MVGVVLATHGAFAEGIRQSAAMVFGDQENLATVVLTPDMGPADFRQKLDEAVAGFDSATEVLILVDLWGGTPFNQSSAALEEPGHEKWAMVTGLNLPMLIECYAMRMDEGQTAHDIAAALVGVGREGCKVKPESLAQTAADLVTGQKTQASQLLPPGTVVGSGKLDIGLCRIDSRLLHGQVAFVWSKEIRPNRIIVVNDGVAHDPMRKTLIVEAAPPGIKVNCCPVSKLIEISKDTRFGDQRVMLIFENPTDVLRAVQGGVELKEINVGSMAHSEGKVLLGDACSVNEKDMEAFKGLRDAGCTFTVKKVPTDRHQDLWDLAKKAGLA